MAIIGHGDIASVLIDRADRIYFASGVSRSLETRESEFQRERALLLEQERRPRRLVYFSSLCVFYADTHYADHKREMEALIRQEFDRYCILRLGNITWGNNPHTLINHLRARYEAGLPLEIRNVYRYVVDLPEFRHWLFMIPAWNCEMNIPGRRMTVQQIVSEFVLKETVAWEPNPKISVMQSSTSSWAGG